MFLLAIFALYATGSKVAAQCKIALDQVDEFDSTRVVAAAPILLGYLVASGNVVEGIDGKEQVEEAKAIFSFANENKTRSFFLTLGVVERKFFLIEPGYNVWLKFKDGPVVQLLNVPDEGEFDNEILMWKYVHTCVVPLEYFHQLKNGLVEKIRIEYQDYKQTIVLEDRQQLALQAAVRCVEERLSTGAKGIGP